MTPTTVEGEAKLCVTHLVTAGDCSSPLTRDLKLIGKLSAFKVKELSSTYNSTKGYFVSILLKGAHAHEGTWSQAKCGQKIKSDFVSSLVVAYSV